LKEKIGLRRFRLRGAKVAIESLWEVITYNVHQAIRLAKRQKPALAKADEELRLQRTMF
jgi:hypothetical protein